jgi:hypothetical protein
VLAVLVVAVAATLAGGAVPGLRPLWAVHVVADLGLAAYLAGLLRLRRLALERAAKVRHLPPAPPAEADGRLRRSVSS